MKRAWKCNKCQRVVEVTKAKKRESPIRERTRACPFCVQETRQRGVLV